MSSSNMFPHFSKVLNVEVPQRVHDGKYESLVIPANKWWNPAWVRSGVRELDNGCRELVLTYNPKDAPEPGRYYLVA